MVEYGSLDYRQRRINSRKKYKEIIFNSSQETGHDQLFFYLFWIDIGGSN
jgi:hypothetical protein